MKFWTLPAGTLIKVHGIPYVTTADVEVQGATDIAVALEPTHFKPSYASQQEPIEDLGRDPHD